MKIPGRQLAIGSGALRRDGWIHVDANPALAPDIVAQAHELDVFADGTVDLIEGCHLFEHLTLDDARLALREWHRVLRRGGMLMLELPNLQRCIEILGQYTDPEGYDFGMIGLFGYPPEVKSEGVWQIHKWGWTPASLTSELLAAGYVDVDQVPIRQTWRRAAPLGRDMRLHARKG